jgi:hypothetical protein
MFGNHTIARAATSDLFFSEYIEGSSNNKALEIYNGTGAAIDLAAAGYVVQFYFNGSTSPTLIASLTGTVATNDVFVLGNPSAVAAITSVADQLSATSAWYNGDDAVVLRKGGASGTIVDVIGQIGFDPGTEWGTGLTSTADNTLRRLASVCAGDTDGSNVFDPTAQWEGFANDTFDGLGSHVANCDSGGGEDLAPELTAFTPADGATDVAVDTGIGLTFSEVVDLSADAVSLVCDGTPLSFSNLPAADVTTITLTPSSDLPNSASCTVTVNAAGVTDNDGEVDTLAADVSFSFTTVAFVDVCAEPFTPIYAIQGSGSSAAITGPVTTQGVVVGDYETPFGANQIRGFYIQDLVGDGDPTTSDGIFVFTNNNDFVSLGEIVRVSGNAGDFQDQTQISGSLTIAKCGTGSVEPTVVSLPVPSADYLERFEGMFVTFPQTLYVTELFQLGRFGQVTLTGDDDRLRQPTNVVLPGAEAQALQAANNLNRIILDDDNNLQNADPIVYGRAGNPLTAANTLRGGDSVSGLTGVLVYGFGGNSASPNAYRVRAVGDLSDLPVRTVPVFQPTNPRPTEAPEVGGSVKASAFNVLNYFLTLDVGTQANCGPVGNKQECRGAETATELERQQQKLIPALLKLDADVLGLIEIENTSNLVNGEIVAVEPAADLVARLNAAENATVYDYIDTGIIGGDTIRVGIIYKPGVVTPVGDFAILDSSVDARFNSSLQRPSLAQTFVENATGAKFTMVVNHFKSKGDSGLASTCASQGASFSPDCDQGDGQGFWNETRRQAALALVDWIASDPTASGDPDVLIVGDLNSYALEDPIRAILAGADDTEGTADDYTNLIRLYGGEDAYSYVFDGQWGYLDHALASSSIVSQVTGSAEYHINSDEPSVLDYNTNFKSANQINILFNADEFRTSDHDPVLLGLALDATPAEVIAEVSGTPKVGCPADCFDGSATVTLSSEAGATIFYSINDGAFVEYSGPFVVDTVGANTVSFYAIDGAGNVGEPTSITVKVVDFPSTALLDNFNRANGRLGSNWLFSTQPDQYRIVNNAVLADKGGPAAWRTNFGANQEASITLSEINPNGTFHALMLKARGTNASQSALLVSYDAVSQQILVEALVPGTGFVAFPGIPATLTNGSVLGARALADGTVQVYVDCLQIGVVDTVPQAGTVYVNSGGRIGVWYFDTPNATFDNFGGGNLIQ